MEATIDSFNCDTECIEFTIKITDSFSVFRMDKYSSAKFGKVCLICEKVSIKIIVFIMVLVIFKFVLIFRFLLV